MKLMRLSSAVIAVAVFSTWGLRGWAQQLAWGFTFKLDTNQIIKDAIKRSGELHYSKTVESAQQRSRDIYYQEQENLARRAIELNPNDAAAYKDLGNAMYGQKRYPAAAASYRMAIVLNPRYDKAYNNLGNVLADQKKYVESEAAYRKAIELNPQNAGAYTNLGNIFADQGRYAEAYESYMQAVTLDPRSDLAQYNLGNLLVKQHRYAEAELAYRRAILLNPKGTYSYNNLGTLLQQLGRLTEARDLYRQALASVPDYGTVNPKLEEVNRMIGIKEGTLQSLSPDTTRYLPQPQETLTRVRRSVVRILPTFSGKSSGAGAHGTGFVVRREGGKAWILTARHVVYEPEEDRKATKIQVELYGGNLPKGIVAARLPAQQVKSGDRGLDLALLMVVGLPEDIQPLNFASGEVIGVGASLTMVGHPGRDNWKIVTGKLTDSNPDNYIVNSPEMAEGGSGSPMLSDKKRVIGMAYAINEPAQGFKQLVGYSLGMLQATLSKWGQ